MLIRFWGSRGSIPTPLGYQAVRTKLREALLVARGHRLEVIAEPGEDVPLPGLRAGRFLQAGASFAPREAAEDIRWRVEGDLREPLDKSVLVHLSGGAGRNPESYQPLSLHPGDG